MTTDCFHCSLPFDALSAKWCSCLIDERSLACPHCHSCACDATAVARMHFWLFAPPELIARRGGGLPTEVMRLDNATAWSVPRPLALVADDDDQFRTSTRRVLGMLGVHVVSAKDGEHALQIVRELEPDLVITDALISRLEGRALCHKIKIDPRMNHTKVVMMSEQVFRGECGDEADAFLDKPIRPSVLASKVMALLH